MRAVENNTAVWTRYDSFLFGATCFSNVMPKIQNAFERLLLMDNEGGGEHNTQKRLWAMRVGDEILRHVELALNSTVRCAVVVNNVALTNRNRHAHDQLMMLARECVESTVRAEFRLFMPRMRRVPNVFRRSAGSDLYELYHTNFVQIPQYRANAGVVSPFACPLCPATQFLCTTMTRAEWMRMCVALAQVAESYELHRELAEQIRNTVLRFEWKTPQCAC